MQTATHVFTKKRVKPVTPVVKPLEKRVKPGFTTGVTGFTRFFIKT